MPRISTVRQSPILWAIADPRGCPIAWTVRYTRRETIEHYLALGRAPGTEWTEISRLGYRVVRVRIVPVASAGGGR